MPHPVTPPLSTSASSAPLRPLRLLLIFPLLAVSTSVFAAPPSPPSPPELVYETHIRPIFERSCFKCHSGAKQESELDLSTAAGVLAGGQSGPVIAGGMDASLLLELIEEGAMPPEDSGIDPPSKSDVDRIRRWIAEGAKFRVPPRTQRVTEHDIVPLMLLRCTVCHGGRRREAGLDLRTRASMLKGGKSGPAVVAGKPDESLVVKRIVGLEMPPRRQLVEVSVKPMSADELTKLKQWIAGGLLESPLPVDEATPEGDPLVSAEDRAFWAFQSPHRVDPPEVEGNGRVRNAVDAFVLARLVEQGLQFNEEADRTTLIRRLYFDLLGLPPTPEEVESFEVDSAPDAYERLVDRLLASPRYGERWARHWLDAAGYADSEGAQNEDRVRPNIWRYRDYVIRAFNSDKPYARFLHEQLAGDELADFRRAETITPEIYDNLVATGFLRTTPDRTFAGITNFVPDRLEVIADELQVFGSSVLGLTIHCSRCHFHKFDPIPQRDYYRLAAVFKDALDEHDWLKPQTGRTLTQVTTTERQRWQAREDAISRRIEPLKAKLEAEQDEAAKQKLAEQIKAIEAEREPEPRIRALWSRGDPSPTFILQRGDYLRPGRQVGPGVPSVLTDGKTPFTVSASESGTTGRRLALARWLTELGHPLTARVLVNRVWKHHFGRGIVRTLDNFGKAGARPTHPELLDWLAVEFVRSGWSIKTLHRWMVTSTAYRQSSQVKAAMLVSDPDNKLLSRMPLMRMDAEVVRDSLLHLSDRLDMQPFGPPDSVEVHDNGLVTSASDRKSWRRSIFVLQRRTRMPTLLESFDFPQMGPNCVQRGESIVATQALHLLNNRLVHDWANRFAERVEREVGQKQEAQIRRVHFLAFGREPTPEEAAVVQESLRAMELRWRDKLGDDEQAEVRARRHALANYCHAVMNSAAFVYID